ncbi:protein phosphatase 2C domain-containing protein [Candidatus Parcubacteria bacterium]|nr:protein phosphatase 2C domain-containing protein [Candidatus Parcubacteria bacterium]
MKEIEIATATIQGRSHREMNKNNQDAFYVINRPDMVIGLVADGCGSCVQSEVGANLVVKMIVCLIEKNYFSGQDFNDLLEKVRLDSLAQFRVLINQLGLNFSKTVNDFFLFTLVGFVLTRDAVVIFSLGDGVVMVNDEIVNLGPFPKNEPPYLMYGLIKSSLQNQIDDLLKFKILKNLKFNEFEQMVIGTDGVMDLINKQGKNIPGKKTVIPDFNDFVKDDALFRNSDLLRRKLSLTNRNVVKYQRNPQGYIVDIVSEKGLLEDDTTLIIVRKRR